MTKYDLNPSPKWTWMMNWCRQHGKSPANSKNWKLAELAYYERITK